MSGSTDLHVSLKSYYKSGGGAIETATTIMTKISEVINSLNDIKKNFGDVAVGTPELGVRDNDAWRINVAMNDDHKVYATLESYPCDENQDKKYQRTVSEIVNRLSGIMEKHGDIPVSTPEIDPYDEDYFNWDISAKMDDDNNCEITMDFNVNKKALKESENELKDLEQDAKQAIHDRIVFPSAHSFTPEQVEILNRYRQVAAPDKPAGEVFKELLDEVAQEPDVARKSEKWVTDTAKELDDLAEGITREQDQGLKR